MQMRHLYRPLSDSVDSLAASRAHWPGAGECRFRVGHVAMMRYEKFLGLFLHAYAYARLM